MPIIRNGQTAKVYKGDYAPYSFYKGTQKLAGYVEQFNSSDAILVNGITYKDTADVVVKGNTVQASDYYAKDGLLTQSSNYYAKDGASSQYTDTKVMGKNLINPENMSKTVETSSGVVLVEETTDYIIIATNANTGGMYVNVPYNTFVVGDSITFSANCEVLESDGDSCTIRIYNATKGIFIASGHNAGSSPDSSMLSEGQRRLYISVTLTVDNYSVGDVLRFKITNGWNALTGIPLKIKAYKQTFMVEKSATMSAFEPYKDTVKNGLVMELSGRNFNNFPATTVLQDRSGNGNVGTASGFNYRTTEYADRIADFVGKIAGSVVENPHLARNGALSALVVPPFTGFAEQGYLQIQTTSDGQTRATATSVNGVVPQQVFSFNIVAEFEKAYGAVPSADQTLAGKIAWLKSNLKSFIFDWTGYGSCPSGNKAYIDYWNVISSVWAFKNAGTQDTYSNTSSSPTLKEMNSGVIDNKIDVNGFVHFLAYTDASDGVTPSTIYTDYVKLTMNFKPASGSDGSGGIKFDGIDDSISIANTAGMLTTGTESTPISFEAWFKYPVLPSVQQVILGKLGWNIGLLMQSTNRITSTITNTVPAQVNATSAVILANTVYHAVAVINNGVVKLYLNGVLVDTNATQAGCSYKANIYPIGIGRSDQWQFSGIMYASRVYNNKELSASEVAQNYFAGVNLNVPSPTDASPVVSNLPAKTYKFTDGTDIYEFTLPEELRGIGSAVDKVVFDKVSKRGFVERRIGKVILDGTNYGFALNATNSFYTKFQKSDFPCKGDVTNNAILCDKFTQITTTQGNALNKEGIATGLTNGYALQFVIDNSRLSTVDTNGFKAWLSSNLPTVCYQLPIITSTPITFTKVTTSPYTEVPMAFLTTTPDPLHPANCYTNLSAGDYKYTSTDGIYEFTLPEELRGINTALDKVVFDRVSHRGYLERRIAKQIFNGTETWTLVNAGTANWHYQVQSSSVSNQIVTLSSHYPMGLVYGANTINGILAIGAGYIRIRWGTEDTIANFKVWLVSQNAQGTPLTVYYDLLTRTRVPLTFTKVASSAKVEVPMAFLTATPSLDYPSDMWSVSSPNTHKVISRGKNKLHITNKVTTSYGISGTFDDYNSIVLTGLQTGMPSNQGFSLTTDSLNVVAGKTYTFSIIGNTLCKIALSGSKVGVAYTSSSNKITFTPTISGPLDYLQLLYASTNNGLTYNETIKVQLEDGAVATTFEPYKTPTQVTLPPLRKIGTIVDEFNPKTAKLTKRISDWLNLSDVAVNADATNPFINFKRCSLVNLLPTHNCSNSGLKMLDYTTLDIPYGANSADKAGLHGMSNNIIPMWVSNDKTGFSDALIMSSAEWQAYFKGYKMCNADGSSPYYKSEVPYTPATWTEWAKVNAVGDSTGITLTSDGVDASITISTILPKPSTNYGVLANCSDNTLTTRQVNAQILGSPASTTSPLILVGSTGNRKCIVYSPSVSVTGIRFYTGAVASGQLVKFKDIRIFELPVGSQIETDFTTLTADQLAIKYPFNGLCVKNWKNIVDGTGQTAVLPTTLATGYTPYKMLYQLSTPVISDFGTPTPLPTYHPTTIIETDCTPVVKATIDATVRVEE